MPDPESCKTSRMQRQLHSVFRRLTWGAGALLIVLSFGSSHAADEPIRLRIIGGIASVSQYTKLEAPFWLRDVPLLTHGRVIAEIHPFDQSGLSGQEMLQLISLGVVPFGTALLALVSADEPELNAADLPLLSPDMASLRNNLALLRPYINLVLQRKYGIELLGVYAYPAQALHCARDFTSLNDLRGRKVRTSSVGQSEMVAALGAVPVILPFAEIVGAIRNDVVDCAITGAMPGNQIGLPNVTSYIHPMAIGWGLSFFGVSAAAWGRLPPDIRDTLRVGIAGLEHAIWDSADRETASGLACDIGGDDCVDGTKFHMNFVPVTAEGAARRDQLLRESILPGWVRRCGDECVTAWNEALAPAIGIKAQGARGGPAP
jgi:TRAP-type C4-dicarboxylate transport system substrate-binding protein